MTPPQAKEQLARATAHLAEMDRCELTGPVSPRQRAFVLAQKRDAALVIAGEGDASAGRREALAAAAGAHRDACALLSPMRRWIQAIESGADIDPLLFDRDAGRLTVAVEALFKARLRARGVEVGA